MTKIGAQDAIAGDPRLTERHEVWARKESLRLVYENLYDRLIANCKSGRTLEVGGGSGNFRSFSKDVISIDIISSPWIDAIADAHTLPFADGVFDNIVMFDVLHHLACPTDFFTEATRILKPGGRLVMIEPFISIGSWPFYHYIHHEQVNFKCDPYRIDSRLDKLDPLIDGNQAIPTMIFSRDVSTFKSNFPDLKVVECQKMALAAYPLSGGFKKWQLITARMTKYLLKFERIVEKYIGPFCGFRMMIVLERSSYSSPSKLKKND